MTTTTTATHLYTPNTLTCGHPPHLTDEHHWHRDYKCIRTHFCRPCVRLDCRTSACNRIECTQTHLRCLRVNRNCVSIYFVILCDKVMFYAIKWDKFIIRWVHAAPKHKMLKRKCTQSMHACTATKHHHHNSNSTVREPQSNAKVPEPQNR